MIVKDYGVAGAAELTSTTETGPDRGDAVRSEDLVSRFVEHLVSFVNDLDILRRSHRAIGIRRRAIAPDPGIRNAVEIRDRPGNVRSEEIRDETILNHRVRFVCVPIRDFWVLVGFVLFLAIRLSPGRQIAECR